MTSIWIPGGWLCFFRWGIGVRLPDVNFIFRVGPVK